MKVLRDLLGFKGRIPRKTFWFAGLGAAIVYYAMVIAVFPGLLTARPSREVLGPVGGIRLYLVILLILLSWIVLYAWIALIAKRLHDRNKSGWWQLPFWFPVMLGMFFKQVARPSVMSAELLSAITFVGLIMSLCTAMWFFIELGFLRGTAAPNKYGPDPLAQNA